MPEIVVISGKGGTGKTSLCAALAHLAGDAVLCDLDVDAPDLHILLQPEILCEEPFVAGNEAVVDPDLCTDCGQCAALCRFGAVVRDAGGPRVDPLRCEGCGVCVTLCPAQALRFPEKHCGQTCFSRTRFGPFVHARLFPGAENSGRLVTLLKQRARDVAREQGKSLILHDGSPGVGCPVIASLSGAHLAVAVAEATASGRHDLTRVADLCDHFRIPVAVVINKADLNAGEAAAIADLARSRGYALAGSLPFSQDVMAAMVARKALTETASPLAADVAKIWAHIRERVVADGPDVSAGPAGGFPPERRRS